MGFSGEIKRRAFDFDTGGDNELVPAVAEKRIQVLAFLIVPASAVDVRLESGPGGAPLTGVLSLGPKEPLVLPPAPAGWLETEAGKSLNLEVDGDKRVAGCLSYVEV